MTDGRLLDIPLSKLTALACVLDGPFFLPEQSQDLLLGSPWGPSNVSTLNECRSDCFKKERPCEEGGFTFSGFTVRDVWNAMSVSCGFS